MARTVQDDPPHPDHVEALIHYLETNDDMNPEDERLIAWLRQGVEDLRRRLEGAA